ncbi:MAG: aminopeptidase [Candidatus Schekmanbacteria bacterium]|nr:aminopeptidase [Candidatus Schekmanbacteria bacterium]
MIVDAKAKLARLLIHYGAEVHKGDLVSLQSEIAGSPLIRELYRETVRVGAYPVCRLSLPDQQEIFLREAPEELLRHCPEYLLREVRSFDVSIRILAKENTQQLAGVDPEREAIHRQALSSVNDAFWKRMAPNAEHPLRWAISLYPTNAVAQDAGMSLSGFYDFVWRACFVDQDDPVAAWVELGRQQRELIDRIKGGRKLRIVGDGTDLVVSIDGRRWVNDDGRKNMPGGEIFTSPVESSANGRIRFTPPASMFGRRVEGVDLEFRDGRVEKHSARYEEAFLGQMLALDAGARYVGEIAFGNNPNINQFTGNVLFDEKVAGTMHLAIGASIPECGGKNQSLLHWDMVCDLRSGGEVYVDGELFQRDGAFVT